MAVPGPASDGFDGIRRLFARARPSTRRIVWRACKPWPWPRCSVWPRPWYNGQPYVLRSVWPRPRLTFRRIEIRPLPVPQPRQTSFDRWAGLSIGALPFFFSRFGRSVKIHENSREHRKHRNHFLDSRQLFERENKNDVCNRYDYCNYDFGQSGAAFSVIRINYQ